MHPVVEIPIVGFGQTTKAHVSFDAPNNNLGGVALDGETSQASEIATITNQGAETLTISDIKLVEGNDTFTLSNIPTDLDTNPITLEFGESFTFGDLSFDPNQVGLDRAVIEVTTNDPNNPIVNIGAVGTGLPQVIYPEWGNDFVAIEFPELGNSFTLRTISDDNGNFEFFLPPEEYYHLSMFDPVTGLVADSYGFTPRSGGSIDLTGSLVFNASTVQDSDGEGLPDDVEFAIGTGISLADTDNDGIDDRAELEQGLDPLGGQGFPTGIIASLPLLGEAKAIVVEGTSDGKQLAYLATGSYGLAIVDASQFDNPIVLGQLDLSGDAMGVDVDPNLAIAAVATSSGGLKLVDVSDPMLPTPIQTVAISNVSEVEVFEGVAYVAGNNILQAIDLLTGEEIQSVNLPGSGTVTDIARDGGNLYTFTSGSDTFSVIGISNLGVIGQTNVTIGSFDVGLSVGNGVAYLAGSGLRTIDVSEPTNPNLIGGATNFFTAREIALNGSGLGLVAAQDQGVGLYDISDPTDTDAIITQFDTPGFTSDVAIASGIAYVADDSGGLQAINYLSFDNQGVAPTVTIITNADLDPNTEGIQVIEGTSVPIQVDVTDDVQVRNVELLVNGEVVSNDVSFPFDFSAIALAETSEETTATVQVRATDTGGNSSLSNLLTLDLGPDTFAPLILSITPAEGEEVKVGFTQSIRINFDEALNVATVTTSNFQLLNEQDEIIEPIDIQLRNNDRIIQLTYDSLPIGDYRLLIQADRVSDRVGNVLGDSEVVRNFSIIRAREFNLSELISSSGRGFVINGIDEDDESGESVSSAGDVNGDGFDDLIIGAERADPYGKDRAGESYVVFGQADFATQLNLSDLDGTNGFVLNGIDSDDRSGISVSSAGDVNGDGFDDLIIGASRADQYNGFNAGESYVVFGKAAGFAAQLNLSDLDGTNGFVLNGFGVFSESGISVSSAGDVNGDGFDDLIIGAQNADANGNTNAGQSYVVFGKAGGFAAQLNLSALDGSNGFTINGIDEYDTSGRSVSSAGDVNGDGFDDLIIGANNAAPNDINRAGESYVVFGKSAGFAAQFNLSDLDGSNGFILNGIDSDDQSGISVSSAGDVNGDGFDDLIIGTEDVSLYGNKPGESYVVFGQAGGFAAQLNLSDLDGSNGFVINGIDSGDNAGFSVSSAGDVNGDGFDDLLIGAEDADPNGNDDAGESYVVFGKAGGFVAQFNLSDLDGSNGFILNGIDSGDDAGISVSSAGDVNGDGFDDLLIGAEEADPNGNSDAGESYVVFGRREFVS